MSGPCHAGKEITGRGNVSLSKAQDTLMGTDPHWRRAPFHANAAPARVVKALAIPGKTGFTPFGKGRLAISRTSIPAIRKDPETFLDRIRISRSPGKHFHSPAPPLLPPKKKSSCLFFPSFVQEILLLMCIIFKYTVQNILCREKRLFFCSPKDQLLWWI